MAVRRRRERGGIEINRERRKKGLPCVKGMIMSFVEELRGKLDHVISLTYHGHTEK